MFNGMSFIFLKGLYFQNLDEKLISNNLRFLTSFVRQYANQSPGQVQEDIFSSFLSLRTLKDRCNNHKKSLRHRKYEKQNYLNTVGRLKGNGIELAMMGYCEAV